LAQVTSKLEGGARAIVMTGAPGAGKTLLLSLIQDAYSRRGRSVSRVDLAALFPSALDDQADLLLIDEADTADASALHTAIAEDRGTARSIVLACRPEAVTRLSDELRAVAVHLAPLSPAQAKDFITARVTKAGRADLFTSAALDRLIEASAGSPQALRNLAGMAMFLAAYAQESQIAVSHVEEAVRSQGGFLATETRSDDERGSVADAAETVLPKPVAAVVEPARSSSLADARFDTWPERRPRRGSLTAGAFAAVAALLLVAIAIPRPVLFGTEHEWAARVRPPSMVLAPAGSTPLQTADSLRALDRVAKAVMPGRAVLVIVPAGPLQPIAVTPLETGALPVVETDRRNVAPLASAVVAATSPPPLRSIVGSQARLAPVTVAPPAAERVPAVPQREASAALRERRRELLAQDGNDRKFGSAPVPSGLALPPKYLTANAISVALLDIAEQAGLRYDDEFVAFRACVFRRVSPGGAEQRVFWRAVEVCIR
jgi:type II secretory pathway predicted ATPase ExeA